MRRSDETPSPTKLDIVHQEIIGCCKCPRLVAWREKVAREKTRRFAEWRYWGRPVPGFGDPEARIAIVGLAPAAHGANRTGRFFTGDRSGDFLFAALHRAGLANQPTSVSRDDGLALRDIFIVAALRCAPPMNHPLPDELRRCAPFLDQEFALLRRVRVVLALGAVAWAAYLAHCTRVGLRVPPPRPKFTHGGEVRIGEGSPLLLGSFHVSQQNTQTGRLTTAMFDAILRRARSLSGGGTRPRRPLGA
jgi:uracil-DNA glycosylase family 4